MMRHKLTLTTNELLVIRECVHNITLKGTEAAVVGGLMEKIYKEINKAASVEREAQKQFEYTPPVESTGT